MRAALRVAQKDLLVELRARELLASGLLTGLLAVAIGALALAEGGDRAAVAAGVLWLALAFAAALLLARSFAAEADRGTLETLLLLPVDRGTVFAGKALAAFALLVGLAVVLVPALVVVLGAPVDAALLAVAPVVLLGLAGIAAAGTMLAAVAAHTRARETLVPVLLLPVLLPLLLAAVPATRGLLAGAPLASVRSDLTLLAGYDLAVAAVSYILFEFATEG